MVDKGITYRGISAEEVAQARMAGVLAAERLAFSQECELKRVLTLTAHGAEEKQALQAAVASSKDQAREARARVRFLRRQVPVTNVQIKEVRKAFLGDWLRSIELEHARHSNLAAAAKDPKLPADLREEAAKSARHVEQLTKAHKVASAELDALEPPRAAKPKHRAAPRRASRPAPSRKRRRKT